MALRDEIAAKPNKIGGLGDWLEVQPNKDEWLDVILDETSFSNNAVAKLLTKHGFKCDWNVVYRFRRRHDA